LIEPGTPVRYFPDASVPADAADAIELGYNTWKNMAQAQFNAKKDDTDIFAMNFTRVDNFNDDISLVFVDAIAGAYAFFNGSSQIAFVKKPQIGVQTNAATKRIRVVGQTTNTSSIEVDTPWSYDGDPDALPDLDLEYSDDSGTTWNTLAPAGFGDLTLLAATDSTTTPATDKIFHFEMDFRTIAFHEIGHSIALGHAGTGIMRSDIANEANFGRTKQIDSDSALAAAIAYTYSLVPEPAAGLAIALVSGALMLRRHPPSMAPRGHDDD
jgi:hypothetical protein